MPNYFPVGTRYTRTPDGEIFVEGDTYVMANGCTARVFHHVTLDKPMFQVRLPNGKFLEPVSIAGMNTDGLRLMKEEIENGN